MKPLFKFIFNFIILILPLKLSAAACCGGSSALPSLISSDDQAQFSTSLSSTEIVVNNVDPQGVWRKWETHQKVRTFKIEGAYVFNDLWQIGSSIPITQRTLDDRIYSGLADVSISLGYEYLPEWSYHPIKPKGIGFFQLKLPTGKSKTDSDVGGLDSTGNGLLSVGIGTLLTKIIHSWDTFIQIEIHHSFNREYSDKTLYPGWGSSWGFGLGYNIDRFRLGTAISWFYEDPIDISFENSSKSEGSVERYANSSLSLSYMPDEDWSGTLTYNDQTIFGNPTNTSLGRGVAFQIQKRWSR